MKAKVQVCYRFAPDVVKFCVTMRDRRQGLLRMRLENIGRMKMRVYDQEDAERINAEQWQLDLLKLNPEYVHWGPYEDYMIKESGWDSRQFFDDWDSFGPWELNELNECKFYFSVNRKSEECKICGGNGYHSDAQEIVNTFYAHMNDSGIHWNDKITQDELDALVKEGRIKRNYT